MSGARPRPVGLRSPEEVDLSELRTALLATERFRRHPRTRLVHYLFEDRSRPWGAEGRYVVSLCCSVPNESKARPVGLTREWSRVTCASCLKMRGGRRDPEAM